ncbi:MAG TPA: pyruvate, phosphate dikinase [Chloroflexota bacterium]|nr:pyruvate, phosphate dikinase [Chloroflexota bacterium]
MVQSTAERAGGQATTAHKWVYLFAEGNAQMRDLLGGKGAGCAEMTRAGLPVPPGFTITTEACNAYYASGRRLPDGLWEQALEALRHVEEQTGKSFGSDTDPLLVSVRSGAKFSMPGMMDTVLNLGLNDKAVAGFSKLTGDERFAYDSYRRFIQMFSKVVLQIDIDHFEHALAQKRQQSGVQTDAELPATALKELVKTYKGIVQREAGKEFPSDPYEQLRLSIEAVFSSWNNKRAIDYRNNQGIAHDLGTAVNVQTMVFGNAGNDSGTGVAFTRDPSTGEKALYGEYLLNAQGEDVVAGIRTPSKISTLERDAPHVYRQFVTIADQMERHYRDVQDLEFTIEHGKLYMLQTRSAKRTAAAAVKAAVDMVNEGLITRHEAIQRIEPAAINQLLLPQFDDADKASAGKAGRLLTKGLNACPGAATGAAVFDADEAERRGKAGESVILVRQETSPDDVHGMLVAKGILTQRGGATSHAAVVARQLGLPCVAGAGDLNVDVEHKRFTTVDGKVIKESDPISIDGSTGEVLAGTIKTLEPVLSGDFRMLLTWCDDVKRLGVWANGDYPRDAKRARDFGAKGIGLCRTEHMFMETERLPIVQAMILAAQEATRLDDALTAAEQAVSSAEGTERSRREQALQAVQQQIAKSSAHRTYHGNLQQLLEFQRGDFIGIFEAMDGLPVVVRLIDPPLHEFLPSYEELLVDVTTLRLKGGQPAELQEKERLLQAVAGMRESNPMLGLRGDRLGIMFPAITRMQVRAIIEAAIDCQQRGVKVLPKIMIPLVGHFNELKLLRSQLEVVARQVTQEQGVALDYKFGTMIEVPRAALTAGEIAKYADFFSFGTNDLTQTTFGYSRDDAEGKFLLKYVQDGILPRNPFQVVDVDGVGRLVALAVKEGRAANPKLEVGICGEHGGDPESIRFFNQAGLDYVSCSPFRVPVARLAAAQAALDAVERDK